ncbi:MAG TPA: DinB family protein [Gemmatimonadales bacterium]|nr:DinB family protein [Gemmatimonadales bacterium]
MTPAAPEPWLRGPVPRIPALLQPAAHAFLMAREDIQAALAGVTVEQLWLEPGGAASLGFHLGHLAGSTGRLLTYARGEALSDAQRAALARERELSTSRPPLEELLAAWDGVVAAALEQLAATPERALAEPRAVGRARLPSTVMGLLFHAAEHAARHTGQIVTTAKLVRSRA